jgi:hypothetical protein
MAEPDPDPANVGETVKVCHKEVRIVETNAQSYEAEGEIGGVIQRVSLSTPYVHDRIGARTCDGCGDVLGDRTGDYCSTACSLEDSNE